MSDTEQIPTMTDKPKRVYKPRVKKVQPTPRGGVRLPDGQPEPEPEPEPKPEPKPEPEPEPDDGRFSRPIPTGLRPLQGASSGAELVKELVKEKPKRERTEKQILAFKKMQEKRKEQDELKKLNKTIEKDKQIHDNHSTKIQKLKDKIISNASLVITNNDDDVKDNDSDDEIHIQQKKVTPKKSGHIRKPRTKKSEPDEDDYEEPVYPSRSRQRCSDVIDPRQVSNDVKYIFV